VRLKLKFIRATTAYYFVSGAFSALERERDSSARQTNVLRVCCGKAKTKRNARMLCGERLCLLLFVPGGILHALTAVISILRGGQWTHFLYSKSVPSGN
jgi:hypothetical protein